MISGDADNAKSLDRVPAAEARSERFNKKQILVWACLIGASVGAVVVTVQNVFSFATTDRTDSCTMSERWGTTASGQVLGFLSNEQSSALIETTQKKLRATINPAYVANKRAVVLVSGAGTVRHVTVLVPAGMTVHLGDQVDFDYGYRDRSLPCSYVPNLISQVAAMPKPE